MSLVSLIVLLALGIPGASKAPARIHAGDVCPARPASRAKARRLAGIWYKKGIGLYKQKAFRRAHEAFVCTSRILDAGLTQYWIARSAQDAGMLQEALALFEQLRRRPPAPVTRREIDGRIAVLHERLAARKTPAGDKTHVDGNKEGRKGSGKGRTQSNLGEAKMARRQFETVAWALWGTGAGLLLTSVVLGTLVGLDQRALEHAGDGTWWAPGMDEKYSRRNGLLAGTFTLVGAGVLAAAAGTALYFLGRSSHKEKVSFHVSPRGAGLRLSLDW